MMSGIVGDRMRRCQLVECGRSFVASFVASFVETNKVLIVIAIAIDTKGRAGPARRRATRRSRVGTPQRRGSDALTGARKAASKRELGSKKLATKLATK
jgi:hypothetical protein